MAGTQATNIKDARRSASDPFFAATDASPTTNSATADPGVRRNAPSFPDIPVS